MSGTPDEKCGVIIMRKLALLLAAALIVSAPLIAAAPTLTYAAGKAKKAGKKGVKVVKKEAAKKEVDLAEVNGRFGRALDDLFRQLATYRYVYDPAAGGDKGGRGGKVAAKKAK
jgi:hypothetical protein